MRKQITGNEEIKLYSWMAQEGLKGNALVVYAIVYDAGEYSGGIPQSGILSEIL